MSKPKSLAATARKPGRFALPDMPSVNDGEATLDFCNAFMEAGLEIAGQRKYFNVGYTGLENDPDEHPDTGVIRAWLVARGRDADYEADILCWLAVFIRNEWAVTPHRTRSAHRELYQRIATLCGELRDALEETGGMYIRGGGSGLQGTTIRELLIDREAAAFKGKMEPFEISGGLPSVPEILERVANAASRFEQQGPLHVQPNKRGAERGYFVRCMGVLFQQRYGERPLEVIAAVTTIALGEATDRELVVKLLA